MKVKDKTFKSAYKGQEIDCPYEYCPCLPCYNCHDCGYRNSKGNWVESFTCATNFVGGCPDKISRPTHIIRQDNPLKRTAKSQRTCLRCGIKFKLQGQNWLVKGKYQAIND